MELESDCWPGIMMVIQPGLSGRGGTHWQAAALLRFGLGYGTVTAQAPTALTLAVARPAAGPGASGPGRS